MNDFDYDVMLKKRTASGAFHRKRGSKSRRCTLPSDHLSAAELKRRNGPMMTYKLNEPMSWEAFNRLPKDLQAEYLRNLREHFSASDDLIAGMFGVHPSSVSMRRNKLGVRSNGRMPRSDSATGKRVAQRWQEFLNGTDGAGCEETKENTNVEPDPMEEVTPLAEAPVEPAEEPSATEVAAPTTVEELYSPEVLHLSDLTAVFRGEFDPTTFLNWITKLPMPTGNVRIGIEVTKV